MIASSNTKQHWSKEFDWINLIIFGTFHLQSPVPEATQNFFHWLVMASLR